VEINVRAIECILYAAASAAADDRGLAEFIHTDTDGQAYKWLRHSDDRLPIIKGRSHRRALPRCAMKNARSAFTPPAIGERSIVMTVSVCLCVCICLSASISPEIHVRSLPDCLCILPMAVARSSSGGVAICYVLPVLCMTSLADKPRQLNVAAQLMEAQSTCSLGLGYKRGV